MADFSPIAATPLQNRAGTPARDVSLEELAFLGKITLRGDPDDAAFMDGAKKALSVALPTQPLSSAAKGDLRVFWTAFDEWLVWTPDAKRQKTVDALEKAMADVHRAVVDVSDYYTVIRIGGPRSRDVLSKGVPVDLHEHAFAVGQATGTVFHHAAIFIARAEADSFDVMIRWSFARYLWDYLVDSAREYAA